MRAAHDPSPVNPVRSSAAGRSAVIVDSLEVLRVGLSRVLEELDVRVSASVSDVRDGARIARDRSADLLIVGKQPNLKPKRALNEAKRHEAALRVLMLIDAASAEETAWLISHDVDGLLLRSAGVADMKDAVRRILSGERAISPVFTAASIGRVGPVQGDEAVTSARAGLSTKELEVLAELASGATYKEIAENLIVTQATVKTHLVHIYRKLGVANRQEAVARGLALGILG